MIKAITFLKPDQTLPNYLNDRERLESLNSLSQINFFIGANNCGKSRLLRILASEFYNYRSADIKLDSFSLGGLQPTDTLSLLAIKRSEPLSLIKEDWKKVYEAMPTTEGLHSPIKPITELFSKKNLLSEYDLYDAYEEATNLENTINPSEDWQFARRNSYSQDIRILPAQIQSRLASLMPLPPKSKFQITYIPIYRSLRKLVLSSSPPKNAPPTLTDYKAIQEPVFRTRTYLDYFVKPNGQQDKQSTRAELAGVIDPNCIFSGETLFQQISHLRNSVKKNRLIIEDFERFLSKHFFNGQKVEIHAIEVDNREEVHIKIGDEEEFPIYQLGDGIQAVILLTFPLFFLKDHPHHLVFIEEPELYLHPGMQRLFVEVLRGFPNVQVFVTTHSNHLLDTSLDFPESISIYAMEKHLDKGFGKFSVENVSSPGMSLLNLLGVRNSSVFLSICTIWVEGISDRLYLKKFLELYMAHQVSGISKKNYSEDFHYSFLEFGGNNIVHYDFAEFASPQMDKIKAKKITSKILLIHDLDQNKQARHQLLVQQLGQDYIALDVLEIENLLSPAILKLTFDSFRKKVKEKLDIKDFNQADYKMVPLSIFADRIIADGQLKRIFSLNTEGRTGRLYDKAGFARVALQHMNNWNDLSPAAQKLTVKIYAFIAKHNQQ
jgi:AAA15 family ATPase/GTPase